MKRACWSLLLLCIVPSLAESLAQPDTEDAKLERHFKAYLNAEFKHRPLEATRAGNHDYDDKLDDVSPQARQAGIERTRIALANLGKVIDYQKLTRSGQIDFEIWQHELKKELWLADNTIRFENDPRAYNDYITESVYSLLTQSTLPQPVNVRNAIARIAQIPKVVQAAKTSLKHPPGRAGRRLRAQANRGAIAFYERGIYELAGDDAANPDLKKVCKALVPVLTDYQKLLEQDILLLCLTGRLEGSARRSSRRRCCSISMRGSRRPRC